MDTLTSIAPPSPLPAPPTSFPLTLNGGFWPTSHVQGIAVDRSRGHIYFSFTTVLVKTDLAGNLLGTVSGFTGHLGDIEFSERDGRVYGSLEYKAAGAFYVAVFDAEAVDRTGLDAADGSVVRTVHLGEVAADYGSGRFGCSGIDGIAFGPLFGETAGEPLLTVAYGIHSDVHRQDNDHQILLQYDVADWDRLARPLVEAAPHRSGPREPDAKVFLYTGNTTFGVQNLDFDTSSGLWRLGVYPGRKDRFPNFTLFAVEARAKPRYSRLEGLTGVRGDLVALAPLGLRDSETGIRGWYQTADVGMESLGGGLFYLSAASGSGGFQTSDLTLVRWTDAADIPFAPVTEAPPAGRPALSLRRPSFRSLARGGWMGA
ncbi:hypothetical protein [Naasia aerilata]|uniref:Phytase-like domain-containing protein n=1 Tax=Naasia aerilata TaxID=1162966 RepID=A0ABM8GBK8_9MICO|nr:hypothetical protein [Naasia aerilata]BDZ45614.1 hypothetical protein GCM10025866_15230 [Naasia aerilata]